ncbi:MAG: T9SS type A sorting domain-containing protein [Flavobacteriales bacterium]|nr:T9SS type A sorting domain-containing protein [Flavobacteriales bacterium]MBK9537161.1 T9SS type A sorting domain-containing protein [Flavobacteriales bacterium]
MMKKTLLSMILGIAACAAQAQVILYVNEPGNVAGNYVHTLATTGWGGPDMNDPLNAVTDTVALVDDGTAADTLACGPLVNDLTGKIALLYRGSCEFGTKSLNAQNAGAVAVIIVNNIPGAPVAMGAGVDGATVTIPVVMVGQDDGAAIRAELDAGTPVVAFLGAINGFYEYSLGAYKADVLVGPSMGRPALVSQDATEFSVELGVYVHNFGTVDQSDVTLRGIVTQGGTEIYNQTSAPTAIVAGDSLFIALPAFSQSSYTDVPYEVSYIIGSSIPDDFTADDTSMFSFQVDSVLSYAPMAGIPNQPVPNAHYRPGDDLDGFQTCTHFRDPNASRMAATGIYTSATTATDTTLDGAFLGVRVYEWLDQFTGLSDPNFPTAYDLIEVTTAAGEYFYTSDQQGEVIFIPMQSPVVLADNQRYLFCVYTADPIVFVGFDAQHDYDEHTTLYDQPVSLIEDDGTWYNVGFGTDVTTALGVAMIPAGNIGMDELNTVEVSPYPNPTQDRIRVPLPGLSGTADLRILDLGGKLIEEHRVALSGGSLALDVTDLSAGTYQFVMNFQDGGRTSFKVMVNK